MEKIEIKGYGGHVIATHYDAAEVDAYRVAVEQLMDVCKELESTIQFTENWNLKNRVKAILNRSKDIKKAIADVEALRPETKDEPTTRKP